MKTPLPTYGETTLEKATFFHVLVLLLASSWIYGGNIWWMRTALSVWASLGLIITIAAFFQPGDRGRDARSRAWWLIPWLLFVLLVLLSIFNPSFERMNAWGSSVLVNTGAKHPHLPSCVDPAKTAAELWFGGSAYLSAFNLLLIPRSRRFLQTLLTVGAVSCLILAVFGTLQKLTAHDLYFGAAHSPNKRFFSTFIYNNHWGAFMILWLSAAAGLIFHHATRWQGRDLWHSAFPATVLSLLIIAASAPVSASRAATAMALIVLMAVIVHGAARIAKTRRAERRAVWPPVVALLLFVAASVGAVGWIAQRSINERYLDTRQAITSEKSLLGGRLELYRDTWTLAMREPTFGWGLESYGTTFYLIRPRPLQPNRQYESSYTEAHSDWLQSVAETGFVGTTLVVLMGLIPLVGLARRAWSHPLVFYPLLGCGLVALYAWIEFPFANGAVLIAFWSLLFIALRYSCLDHRARENAA